MGSCGPSYCVCLISLGTVSPMGGRCQNVPPQKAEPHPLVFMYAVGRQTTIPQRCANSRPGKNPAKGAKIRPLEAVAPLCGTTGCGPPKPYGLG